MHGYEAIRIDLHRDSGLVLKSVHCLVTAGPTYEPLDRVRRLTNFSTGRLGTTLAGYLMDAGHQVTLCLGELATWNGEARATEVLRFSTTQDLARQLESQAKHPVQAVFHAAAVNDFAFGQVWRRTPFGPLEPVQEGKVSTRAEGLLVELVPAPKIIASLRTWFPKAQLVGWKYEVDGDRNTVLKNARDQITSYQTQGCVVNGPAYGSGYGWIQGSNPCVQADTDAALFALLSRFLQPASGT